MIPKLKDLINEELFGEFGGYEVYKNPKSIKRMSKDLRGISLPNGDLYVVDTYNIIHVDIHKYLRKKGIKLPSMHTSYDLAQVIQKGYINWQRDKLTDTFYLSESSPSRLDSETSKMFKKYVKKVKQKNLSYKFIEQSIWDR